ncbi:lysozyme-like domain-containing protein [Umbelopsis sp. AD052]|nr:lysozyme-like domain-containing protein [Umbelopsis sp. AD052]
MKISFAVVNGLALLAALVSPVLAKSKFPYCTGSTYGITHKNCAKFKFDTLHSNCVETSNCTTFYDITKLPTEKIDAHTEKMAQLITNVFENGNTVMGYAYVEALGDGRGYTSGYIGFTSGTNDALTVIKQYTKRKPKNGLTKYVPELTRLSKLKFCDRHRNDTKKLSGYPAAWTKTACSDPNFVQTQLDVGFAMYLAPALKYAASVQVKSNLGKAIFYDTIINHGWQYVEPLINLPRILQLTGPRKHNESEKSFLNRFLVTRRQLMCCFPDDVWPPAADRVADLQRLVSSWSRNKDLKHPVTLKIYGVTVKGTEDLSFDKAECPKKPKGWKLPKAKTLPIPDTCPNKLLSL